MSEENQDILTYRPIQEWTGHIVDFGMPTHDGNKSLTEIVTSSHSALEATKRAMELSFFSDTLAPARSPEKLEIVRWFFGGDIGGNLAQLDLAVYEEALISHFIESFFSVSMPEFSGTKSYIVSWDEYKQGVGFVDFHQIPHTKDVRNPIGLISSFGNNPITGNWDTDGMPYIQIAWDPVSVFHCSDPTYNDQTSCEASVDWGYCRTNHTAGNWAVPGGQPMTISMNHTGGLPAVANIGLYNDDTYCVGTGQCYYSSYNTDTTAWTAYGNPNSGYNENWCMINAPNYGPWAHLYWMWRAGTTNTFTEIHNNWFPDPDTVAAHQHYNLLTSDNHRHMPALKDSGTNYYWNYWWTDTFPSFGNGLTDGRSIHPHWVTNTFEWESDDCSDTTPTVASGAFVSGIEYTILDPGDTDFTLIGAVDSVAGTVFVATGVGIGTGTATYLLTTCVPYTHDVPIDPDYWTKMGYGPHSFVNSNNGDPQSMYGYNSTYFDYAQVRWRPPQYNYNVYQRTYPPPDKYRIYRSPYFSPGGLSLTDSDYQAGIWKLCGEVAHNSDTGYHYFQDLRLDLANIGIEAYQSVGYAVTAVWEKWNWKRGLSYSRHYGFPYQWDPALYEYIWPNYVYGDLNWATTGHPLTGAVIPSPDIQYEDFAIRLDDNTNYRFHRYAGYFKASVTGQYEFRIGADDSGYLWLGSADQSVSTLEGNRTAGNALCSAPGLHSLWYAYGYINLTAGAIYPILFYQGNHGGDHEAYLEFTPPGGIRTFDGSDHYYPESGIGAVNPSANDGQFVEGDWSATVFSSYRN